MNLSKKIILLITTLCFLSLTQCSTDAEVEQVLQQLREKLAGIEKDLETLGKLKQQEQPQLFPEEPHPPKAIPVEKQKSASTFSAQNQKPDEEQRRKRALAVQNVGVRSMPTEDSSQMKDFKASLTPEQQQLLKNHYSKSRFIQALLSQQTAAVDKRDLPETAAKIPPELQEYYQHLTPQEQELLKKYPSQANHLLTALHDAQNPVEEETSEDSKRKRQLDDRDWSVILKDMLTHIDALKDILRTVAAQHHINPISNDELANKILEDIKLAKDKGIKLEDLLRSLKIPGHSAANVNQLEAEDRES